MNAVQNCDLIDKIVDGVIIIDCKEEAGIIKVVNKSAHKMFGYKKGELVGKNVSTLMPSPYRENHDNYIKNYLKTNKKSILNAIMNLYGLKKDGSIFPIELSVSHIDRTSFIGIVRDMTIFNSVMDAMLITDENLKIVKVNRATEELFGYNYSFLSGRDASLLIKDDDEDNYRKSMTSYIYSKSLDECSKTKKIIKTYGCRKDGVSIPIEISVSKISKNMMVQIIRDVSEIVSYLRELENTKLKLEKSNNDLTNTIKRLELAKLRAENANSNKNDYLSKMSHELRTPLNSIIGFSQLLELSDLSKDDAENVKQIMVAGKYLLNIINDVMDISKIESDNLPLIMERTRIKDVIEESINMLKTLAKEKGVGVNINPINMDFELIIDRQRLKQVLINILSNAIKYNRRNGKVKVKCVIKSSIYSIKIIDTGIGINEKLLSKIFQPFERIGAEQSRVEGTGLGLLLSKKMVELMDGDISVESVLGKGSTFSIDFNIDTKDMITMESNADLSRRVVTSAQPKGLVTSWDHRSLASKSLPTRRVVTSKSLPTKDKDIKVLCIEDNNANLKLIEKILKKMGNYKFIPATEGKVGLELAKSQNPAIILLDINLPDMEGDRVLKFLRKDPINENKPIIIISALSEKSKMKKLKSRGTTEYVTKPINVKKFIKLLERYTN